MTDKNKKEVEVVEVRRWEEGLDIKDENGETPLSAFLIPQPTVRVYGRTLKFWY